MPSPKNIKRAIYDKIKQTDLLRMTGKTIGFRFIIVVAMAVVVGLSFIMLKSGGIIPLIDEDTGDIFTVVLSALFISCLLIISAYFRRTVKRFISDAQDYLYEDPLTGLPNLMKFQTDAEELVKNPADKQFYIISIDINNLKYINDAYGYSVGDETLVYIAESIVGLLNDNGACCRAGGDDFAVLLSCREPEDLKAFFREFRKKVREAPIYVRHKYNIKFNAGVYMVQPNDKLSIAAMYDRARLAYESACPSGSSDYHIYNEALREQIHREKQIEQEMYAALENGEFEIYLQPKWDIQNGDTIVGAETLVRWNSPARGMLYPNDFLPVLEKSGFIVEVDRYVFELVCSYFRSRLDSMLPVIPLSVNLSEQDIKRPDFIDFYVTTKNKYKIPDGLLQLEFTERIIYDDVKSISNMIRLLQGNGFVCSIDDFGKGNSSLNAIMDLPVNDLKLDMVFFKGNNLHERTETVLKSIISMAKQLGMKTVAEGVESRNQVEFLRRVGCDEIQGYIFGKPMPARLMDDYINTIPKRRILQNSVREPVAVRAPLRQDIFVDERFLAALDFVDATVTEIDLDLGVYQVVSDYSFNAMTKPQYGYYDQSLQRNAEERVHPSDREMYLRIFSVMGIKSAFYRGERRISYRFRALDSRNREYVWFETTVLRLENEGRNRAISFTKNVHLRKWMDENGGEDRVRLANTVLSMFSHVYELDLDALAYRKPAMGDDHNEVTGQYVDLVNNISNMIEPYQRHSFAELLSPGNLRRLLAGGGARAVQAEYKFFVNNEYRWHSLTIVAGKDNPNRLIAICFIQDIHDYKREVLERSTKIEQLKGTIISSFREIVEVNLAKDTFIDIGRERSDLESDNRYLQGRNYEAMFKGEGSYSNTFERILRSNIHPDDRQHISQRFSKEALIEAMAAEGKSEVSDRCRVIRKDGGYEWIRIYALAANPNTDKSTIYLYCKSIEDVTKELQLDIGLNERDSLTGVYNRYVFEQIVGSFIDSKTDSRQHALLLVEVDSLNEIIKKWGHMTADEVLRSMADMLRRSFRSEDVIGRIDGNCFAVFMKNIVSVESAGMKAEQIRRSFHGPLGGEPINDIVTCCVGAAVSGGEVSGYKQMLGNAKLALSKAKAEGKSRVRFHSGSGQLLR